MGLDQTYLHACRKFFGCVLEEPKPRRHVVPLEDHQGTSSRAIDIHQLVGRGRHPLKNDFSTSKVAEQIHRSQIL